MIEYFCGETCSSVVARERLFQHQSVNDSESPGRKLYNQNLFLQDISRMFSRMLMSNKYLFRYTVCATISASSLFLPSNNMKCNEAHVKDEVSSTIPTSTVEKIVVNDMDVVDDEEKWEHKKNHCSFCKTFLESPCIAEFKIWNTCVDMSRDLEAAKGTDEKDTYIEACSAYSRPLFDCVADNHTYFEKKHAEDEAEFGDDDVAEDDGVSEHTNDVSDESDVIEEELEHTSKSTVFEVKVR